MNARGPERRLVALLVGMILITSACAASAHTIHGVVESALQPGWVLAHGTIAAYEVDVHPGDIYQVDPVAIATGLINGMGEFTLTFPWTAVSGPPIPPHYESGDPDLIFIITQNSGSVETVYQELPVDLHPNVSDGAFLTFEVTSPLAVLTHPSLTPGSVPNDHLFLFTRVGNLETADIDCIAWMGLSTGYYRARAQGYSGTQSDVPFGRTLDLFGWFGRLSNVDYYRVRYSTDGGSSWHYVKTSLPNKWYDTSNPNPLKWKWVSQSMGPFSAGGLDNLYVVPHFFDPDLTDAVPAGSYPWSFLDRIARLDSTLMPDGVCWITIEGYQWSGSALVPAPSLVVEPNYGQIKLNIDNSAPVSEILALRLNGVPQPVCSVLELGSSDVIQLSIKAWDALGHLDSYRLSAQYGHSQAVSPIPSGGASNYGMQPGQSWQGCDPCTVSYSGSSYAPCTSPGCGGTYVMPSCAYQFRLMVTKRTTNGYGRIYVDVTDTWHVSIERP